MDNATYAQKRPQWHIMAFPLLPIFLGLESVSGTQFAWHALGVCLIPVMLFLFARHLLSKPSNENYLQLFLAYRRRPLHHHTRTLSTIFAWICVVLASAILLQIHHAVLMLLLLAAIAFDQFVVPQITKRVESFSILGSGLSVCLLPIIGASCLSNHLDVSVLLQGTTLLIAMSLAHLIHGIYKRQTYRLINIPTLANTHSLYFSKLLGLILGALLSMVTLCIYLVDEAGLVYLSFIMIMNAALMIRLGKLHREPGYTSAKQCYRFSMIYMLFFMILMCADHYFSFLT